MAFTIFYDGHCPLCQKEIKLLQKHNHQAQLAFVDIMQDDFAQQYPHLDWQALHDRIHGMQDDGTMLIGLDATHKAWSLVGKGWVYAPLRWPVVRIFADWFYVFFAKHRHRISYWLTFKKRGAKALPCTNACESKFLTNPNPYSNKGKKLPKTFW